MPRRPVAIRNRCPHGHHRSRDACPCTSRVRPAGSPLDVHGYERSVSYGHPLCLSASASSRPRLPQFSVPLVVGAAAPHLPRPLRVLSALRCRTPLHICASALLRLSSASCRTRLPQRGCASDLCAVASSAATRGCAAGHARCVYRTCCRGVSAGLVAVASCVALRLYCAVCVCPADGRGLRSLRGWREAWGRPAGRRFLRNRVHTSAVRTADVHG